MHPIPRRPIGRHLHTNTSAPVGHGGVAGVDVDADAVARSGISGAADGVQALQGATFASNSRRRFFRRRFN